MKSYSSIRGTHDFSPQESRRFSRLGQQAASIFDTFAYEEIILPILEEKDLFIRSIGEGTDIVEKQMFKIQDKDIVLRPEGTAQVLRYFIQYGIHKQGDFHKFYYRGPMFRGERPQKGRLRQFHHIGAEAIGSNSYFIDAEMIMVCLAILEAAGITEKELKINTLGCAEDKKNFSESLRRQLEQNAGRLCEDCRRRLVANPLRVLDCKEPQCRAIVDSLDLASSHLCQECKTHFENLLSVLDASHIAYVRTPRLVRGLDYYTNTVFEVTSAKLGSQDAIGAGGRYNTLMRSLGGPDMPAIGFALGVERMLLLLGEPALEAAADVFVAPGAALLSEGFALANDIRRAGIACDFDFCQKSLKGQLRLAQKRGCRFVVIVGESEWEKRTVVVKDMQSGKQDIVQVGAVPATLESLLK